jgi:membrane protein implicated in regulation of membrane protease activity
MFTILWTLTAAAAIVLSVTYHWWVVKRQKLEKIHVNAEMEQLRKRNTVLEQILQAERLRLDQSNWEIINLKSQLENTLQRTVDRVSDRELEYERSDRQLANESRYSTI